MLFKDIVPMYTELYVNARSKRMGGPTKHQIFQAYLLPFFGEMEIEDIRRKHGTYFAAAMKKRISRRTRKPMSNKSINNWITLLANVLDFAVDEEIIDERPVFRFMEAEDVPFDRLTLDELRQLLSADIPTADKVQIALVAYTGMRIGECRALNWASVDLKENFLTLWQSSPSHSLTIFDQTKTSKIRKVPLHVSAQVILRQLHGRTGLVFSDLSKPGLPLSYQVCEGILTRACAVAGLRRITWHILRHTFTSIMVDAKVHISEIQNFLGHSDIRTTQRYIHVDGERAHLAMGAMDSLLSVNAPPNSKTSIKSSG